MNLRKENFLAFSMVWLILSMMTAYVIAQFFVPLNTETSGGLLGLSTDTITVFNWKLFLYFYGAIGAVGILIQFSLKAYSFAISDLLVLGLSIGVGFFLGAELSGIEESSGILGFNSVTSKTFHTGFFLAGVAAPWLAYVLFRFLGGKYWSGPRLSGGWGLEMILLLMGLASFACYLIGIHLPLFESRKFWIFEDEVSLMQSITAFLSGGDIFLGVIVLLFTLVFPVIKFLYMFWGVLAIPSPAILRVNKILGHLGKYSMLDVFIVALLLLNMKFDSSILDMQLRSGVVFFSISIILTMVVSSLLGLRDRQAGLNPVAASRA